MRIDLDDDLEALRRVTDAQAARRVAPLAAAVDREQRFSPELWEAVRDLGLTRLPFAVEHGGDGGDARAFAVASIEVARHGAVAALYPGTSIQVGRMLLDHGTPEQVARHVPDIAAGEIIAAWAFTEPATGSDPHQITTRARRDGDGWVLDGSKLFISYAGHAHVAMVFARTSESRLGAFLVDTADPGWQVGRSSEVLGMGGTEAAPVTLDGVRVGADDLIGAPDAGFEVMLAGEAFGKIRASAISVGIAIRAIEEASTYAVSRTWRDTTIARRFPTLRAALGAAAAEVLAAESLVFSCADLLDRGHDIAGHAAAARLVSSRAAREAALAALHTCGAYGMTRDMVVERLYREAVFFDVTQGVSEIQQVIVGREVLAEAERRRP